ncbi:MAG: MCE family protein [Candidatus Dadabacteria bacterium]|nr:MCE family protein [Candidatus Dadabacteria bacterium]NIQ14940.1 MCE family protein [Candidatus Dadabacteria bacterium]
MKKDSSMQLKIGLFVLVSIIIFVVGIFTISGDSKLFERKYLIKTNFQNTAGLLPGAYVRLSGVQIGSVSVIKFPDDPDNQKIEVHLTVNKDGFGRVTPDSKATIRTEGLLGAKYIEILRGEDYEAELSDGSYIESFTPPELMEIIGQSEEFLTNLTKISRNLDSIVEAFANEENIRNIEQSLASFRESIEAIAVEEGALNTLIYDQEFAADLKIMMKNFKDISQALSGGEGTLGALLIDPSVHDSLKGVLSEAERSRFLRATVKYMLDKKKEENKQ